MPGTVLVVCSANQCRSPLAEHQLREAARSAGLDWIIGSAGTQAQAGRSLDPDVAAVLRELHITPARRWASRRLDAAMIEQADLVLTAERAHRGAVAELVPDAVARTFTLLEFARTLTAVPPGRADGTPGGLVDLAEQRRIHAGPSRPSDDLPDPIDLGRQAFRACADEINRAVVRILLSGASSSA
jgi:protein-tyrosine-phosphatase